MSAQLDRVTEILDAHAAGATAGEPEPLRRPLPPAAAYPLDALGDTLGAAARRMRDVVQAPDAICGQSILAGASLAAQAHADVSVDGRREPLSLWCVTIAESGERKSAVDQVALDPHRAHERRALEQYRHDEAAHAVEREAHEAAARSRRKGKEAAAIEASLRALGAPPEPPLKPLLLVGTPTIEGLHVLYRVGQPSVGLFHDDAGEFIGGHAMDADHRMRSAAGLSHLWDRGEFDRVRAADGAEKYFGRRLSLHLMMQPVIAESILGDDVLIGQGFLARSLLAWPTSTIGTRQYVAVDLSTDSAVAHYGARVTDLLTRPPPLRSGSRNELEPRILSLEPSAKARWIAIHNAVESDMRDGGDYASVRPWAAKAASQMLRIAGVLTLFNDPDSGVIQTRTIDHAAELVSFALGEAVRIVGTVAVPIEIRRAEALLAWCRSENIVLLHSQAALQFGPSSIRTKPAFDAAIEALERAGWATRINGGCEVNGAHRRRVWSMHA